VCFNLYTLPRKLQSPAGMFGLIHVLICVVCAHMCFNLYTLPRMLQSPAGMFGLIRVLICVVCAHMCCMCSYVIRVLKCVVCTNMCFALHTLTYGVALASRLL